MFGDSPLADAGIYRMGKECLPTPSNVVAEEGHSATLRLKPSHPPAQAKLVCLARLCERSGTAGILGNRSVTIFM
jgi:hypothetical protein